MNSLAKFSGCGIARISVLIILAFLLGTGSVSAQTTSPIQTKADVIKLFEGIRDLVATIFWIVAVIAFFYSGFLYFTAAGDSQKVGKAKMQLIYGTIAVAIGLMAYGMPQLVQNILKP